MGGIPLSRVKLISYACLRYTSDEELMQRKNQHKFFLLCHSDLFLVLGVWGFFLITTDPEE